MKAQPAGWVALGLALGLAVGLGTYTFFYARVPAYLTNNSAACANCHVMRDHFDGWEKSSHHAAANCNDCHTPHHLISKYAVKSVNGFLHSYAFTAGRFTDAIRIKPRSARVAEGACRNCHQDTVDAIEATHRDTASTACLRCHASVGHLDDLGESSSPAIEE